MKRALVLLLLTGLAAIGVDALGDLTQDRPDPLRAGTRSEIVLEVTSRTVHGGQQEAIEGLWGVCQGTVHNRLAAPGIVAMGGGRFRLATEPAVGEHSWRRLQGCLEDLTVDQVLARVVSKTDVTPAG